jgi:BirA family transcriptional regulator, biotin operon repressor / biotin---[acetyl-CoA-carboxylase] ligase
MEALFVGKNTFFLNEIDSTNSYATLLLKNVNLPEGTVVHTLNQKKGKGMRGNSWFAEPQSNLTCSIVLYPSFLNIEKQFLLYQMAALAVYDTTAELLGNSHFDIKIKWPNDILVNRKKIAGILIENSLIDKNINWSVVGIGLNINQRVFNEQHKATSIYQLTQQNLDVSKTMEILCKHIEKYYLMLKSNGEKFVTDAYLNALFSYNKKMLFESNGKREELIVRGVSSSGLLLLEASDGKYIEADVKDFIWHY